MDRAFVDAVEQDGFAILRDALEPEIVSELLRAVSALTGGSREQGVYRRGTLYGIRNLFDLVPETRDVLRAKAVREAVLGVLGPGAFCVRSLFLDKTPRGSRNAPWRQDVTIVVKEKAEVTGFGPWMMKAGRQHVVAPPGTLSTMLSLRLHLDDTDELSAMRVVRASHQYGRLPEDSIEQFTRYDVTRCVVGRRGLLAMRPLLLRASGRAAGPESRRLIHLDFCARNLPMPLEWRERHALPD
jgi:Phytanoyl-CoA dioxygenase (PhyH)